MKKVYLIMIFLLCSISINAQFTGGINDGYAAGTMIEFNEVITLAAPVLTVPANNAANQAINPTFTWTTVPNASAYNLQVSTSQDFDSTVFNQTGITDTTFQAEGLAYGTQYFWRVKRFSLRHSILLASKGV